MAPEDAALYDAERLRLIDRGQSAIGVAKRLTRELKTMDPYIEGVVFISERVADLPPEDSAPGVVPGRWHVAVRARDPREPMMFWPLCGPEGEYRDPDNKLIDDMKGADLWRSGALEELRKRHERQHAEAERAKQTAREARIEQGAHIFRAAKRVAGEGGMTARRWGRGVVGHGRPHSR